MIEFLLSGRKPVRALLPALLALLVAACGGGSSNPAPTPAPPPSPPPPPPASTVGLDARPANLSCIAPPRPMTAAAVALEREFENLAFASPLGMLQAPGDTSRWFVLEKNGRVRAFASDPDTAAFDLDFIDLNAVSAVNAAGEGGLLGMAFHPDYPVRREVFLSWTEGNPMVSVIARFTVNPGGNTVDAASRQDILRVEQDFNNHNGGNIAFGPDGLLYIGFGDGGSSGDPRSRAQETGNLLGAMLRIDVDGGAPYAIPPGNPFAGNPSCPADPDQIGNDCPEIFAWGLRNPWRYSFDRATGSLWLGDVGQNALEEIDRIELNGNYGWDCREGTADFGAPAPSCATAAGLIDPVHVYGRSAGRSVTGGFVYRGSQIPELVGDYLFADFTSGRLWRLVDDGAGGLTDELLLETGLAVVSFGQRNDGELYLVDYGGGIYRIAAGGGSVSDPIPARLSATGCMSNTDPSQPGSGLVPYAVAAPFWSDGATKSRWLAVPDGTVVAVEPDGDFVFPPGSVIVKQFRLSGNLIETRLMMRHPDGVWAGYTYEWDAGLGDGRLVTGGKTEDIAGQDWHYPSGVECNQCHTAAAGATLGLERLQLNGALMYPATGRTANQLTTLTGVGLVDAAFGDPGTLTRLVDPADNAATRDDRARSYLHTNCAQCHRPGGPTPSNLDLRFETRLDLTAACDMQPQSGDLGLGPQARIIAPGNAAASVLVERMRRRDAAGMPPLASSRIDAAGVGLLSDWIDALTTCN